MRTALLFMAGNFVGPEYYARLIEAGRPPDLVCHVGRIGEKSVAWERERTGGLWNPPPLPQSQQVHAFASLKSPELAALIRDCEIDICIQGGIGILKADILAAPRIGWVNVHPGKLPEYRGNACPEWAVFNGDEVWATAHLIDEGIDTGPVICAGRYDYDRGGGYASFRSGIYAHCAQVLIEALARIEQADEGGVRDVLKEQDHSRGVYREKLPDDALAEVKRRLDRRSEDENMQAGAGSHVR